MPVYANRVGRQALLVAWRPTVGSSRRAVATLFEQEGSFCALIWRLVSQEQLGFEQRTRTSHAARPKMSH